MLSDLDIVKMNVVDSSKNKSNFIFEHLNVGDGLTIGNMLRRLCISKVPGVAIVGFKMSGALSEFSGVDGFRENMIEISLNLKKVLISCVKPFDDVIVLKSTIKKGNVIRAIDIINHPDLNLINSSIVIANTNSNIENDINFEVHIKMGTGYSSANENRKYCKNDLDFIPISTTFSPVENVSYFVERNMISKSQDYDKLTLTIETNGMVEPKFAFEYSVKYMKKILENLVSDSLSSNVNNVNKNLSIDNMGISSKTLRYLKDFMDVNNIKDLSGITKNDMYEKSKKVAGIGDIAITKMIEELQRFGFDLE